MQFEWISSDDSAQLKAWDQFLMDSPRGHYCQLSTWLKSYTAYGFDFAVLVARCEQSGSITGGAGLLWLENRIFRIMTVPIGPIVDIDQEDAAGPILQCVLDRARSRGAGVLQLRFPCSAEREISALLPAAKLPELPSSQVGVAFKYGGAHTEMQWIELPQNLDDSSWRAEMLRRFGKHHRQAIRRVERNGLEASDASTEAELREAYSLIEENARLQGYPIRTWADFGKTLIEQVNKGQAVMLVARYGGGAVGAHYGVLPGKRYTYILGGIVGAGRDLEAGYFLQWAAMNRARRLGALGYDLTSMGPPSVRFFKQGFHAEHIPLIKPRYLVFSKLRHKAFSWAYPTLRKHRDLAGKVLHVIGR